jgi:hypothetical protein
VKHLLQPLRLLVPALLLTGFSSQAQYLNYSPLRATNTAGTYTTLSTGTSIVIPTANTDDANSTPQAIGFAFNYNGATFTDFVLNTNGFVKLGTTAPSAADLFPSQNAAATNDDPLTSTEAADVNLLMPFNQDLVAGNGAGGAEYRSEISGIAPNRVLTVQWKNVSDKAGLGTDASASQYASFSFQVKLYETTNAIEFVYDAAVASTGTATARFPNVGIKGSGSNSGQTVLGNKTASTGAWSTTVFITGSYGSSTHNYRANVGPDAGRTYRFLPSADDASVGVIYSLGKVSSAYGAPVVTKAFIINSGSTAKTNLPVTLTVSGSTTFTNTQTIATLAPGAATTVTFGAYSPMGATGTNTLTVTLPADDLTANSTSTLAQQVTAADQSYIAGTTFAGGAGVAAAGSVIAVGYANANPLARLVSVTPTFSGASTAGSTYQVVVYSADATGQPGTVLFTSAARPRPTPAAPATTVSEVVTLNVPVTGNYFVGLKTVGANNLSIAYQAESPLRAGTFFFTTNGTTWTDINTTTLPSRLAVEVALTAVSGTRGSIAGEVSLYPNPASRAFTLALPALTGERTAQVSLLNSLGQQVRSSSVALVAAGTQTRVDVAGLAPGLYTVRVQAGAQTAIRQVVVE